MRYTDGPSVACELYVEAAPPQVWELVTDIHLPARLSPELQRVEWLDGADGPRLGASFVGYNRHQQIGEWRTVCQVVELEEQRRFGWTVLDVDGRFAGPDGNCTEPAAAWCFELAPETTGTRLRQTARIGPGRSGISLFIDQMPEREEDLVAFRLDELRTNMTAALRSIRGLAEGDR
ncbi:SRPBCC family protein [Micromonospora sp. NBC_01655]|uniref:SRPBCC family protein n=1 Tax=Micromonospora sp. NBC_01655 TaxID=2975983 RepID=UPI00225401E9|nr:SRPBCC family protein [Micromonospora sp. NBC_01655]MCX4472534.1 SRPBCC family protein [Micromonospora sp. NBC_01655]